MAPEPDKSALEAFLKQYWNDRDEETVRSIREYLERFPGADDAIAAEFTDLQRQERPDSETDADSLGPYRLEEEIGRGGQGVVYRATDTRVGRRVALKVLKGLGPGSEKVLSYFKREAAIASRLDHPGLCPVYDAEIAGGIPYIAMRYVDGETLAKRITLTREDAVGGKDTTMVVFNHIDLDEGPDTTAAEDTAAKTPSGPTERPTLIRALRLIEKTARALHAAHEAGVIHRDVKPGNVMVTPAGEVVVMDFGLARDDDNMDLQTLTQSGDLFGTPAYMSPEQLTRQSLRLDRRTDVWSLGVMLYECVTLRRPFDAATRENQFQKILMKDPTDPRSLNPHLPRDLVTVIQTALEKDRDRRYQTALDLAEELRRIREYEPIKACPVSTLTRLVRWSQRNPALATMTGAAALILIIGAAAATRFAVVAASNAERAEKNATQAAEALADKKTALENAALRAELFEEISRRHDEAIALFDEVLTGAVPLDNPVMLALVAKARGRGETASQVHAKVTFMLARAVALWREGEEDAAVQVVVDEGLIVEPTWLPRVPYTLSSAARLLNKDGRPEAAMVAALAAVRIGLETESLGERHPQTLEAMTTLGNLYRQQDDSESAITWLRRAHEQWSATMNPNHSKTINAGGLLMLALEQADRLDEARPLRRELLAAVEKGTANHMTLLLSEAADLIGTDKRREAAALLDAGLKRALKTHRRGHKRVVSFARSIAALLRKIGRDAEATAALEAAGAEIPGRPR